MRQSLTAVLAGEATVQFGRERLPQWLTSRWTLHDWVPDDGLPALQQRAQHSDAVIGSGFGKLSLADCGFKLFHIPFAGYDWLKPGQLPAGCTVCNVYEHEIPIAEYVMLNILEWEVRLAAIDADFRAGSWRYCMPSDGPYHGEAYGKTLGFIGYGHIAKAIAQRASAFGLRCIAAVPSERPLPAPLDWLGLVDQPADFQQLLADSDYLVITCPLNKQTRGLIDAQALTMMKPDAVLINVARGKIVDEQALYNALRERTIKGATIDTWYHYPLEPNKDESVRPSSHPFHELDNLIMTPHCSAWTHQLIDRRWRVVAANLDRYARGEPLQNVITTHPGTA